MRIIHFPTFWTILLDFALWFVIHMAVVIGITGLPQGRFRPEAWLYRERPWEEKGKIYQRLFRIRKWKGRLPDGASLMKSRVFPKKVLEAKSDAYFLSFLRETCRAELTHWLIVFFAPFFFLWNPFWVGWVMIGYALAENLPLIVAQRYNRYRLRHVLAMRARKRGDAGLREK